MPASVSMGSRPTRLRAVEADRTEPLSSSFVRVDVAFATQRTSYKPATGKNLVANLFSTGSGSIRGRRKNSKHELALGEIDLLPCQQIRLFDVRRISIASSLYTKIAKQRSTILMADHSACFAALV